MGDGREGAGGGIAKGFGARGNRKIIGIGKAHRCGKGVGTGSAWYEKWEVQTPPAPLPPPPLPPATLILGSSPVSPHWIS